ncbi:hypothetical protein [Neisseria sp. 83E34]|uniref:hypothetical protein n=1 Tax=Neisseria sp. 83E34 TaxID=1692264 RepID=UPI0006CE760C|nr:hypothetical protein [Neisseria sp. 83E34]KPN72403.1 hypothetical protein AKG09_00685 [Neisseria sp. 83E34]
MNQNQAQQAAAPQSKQNPSKTPSFRLYSDGLGTFLAIAADAVHEMAANKQLAPADITILRNETIIAATNFGQAMETLGGECLDNSGTENTAAAALMMAGRFIQEMGSINESLNMAESAIKQAARNTSGEEWPSC